MIKAKGVLFLDGDFRKIQPTHEVYSQHHGQVWSIVKCGPRYSNVYEVTEFDADGLKKLEAMECKDVAPPPSPGGKGGGR